MADFETLKDVTKALQDLLKEHITNNPQPQLTGVKIDLRSPKEMREDNKAIGVSFWLYRVTRNADLLNLPAPRPALDQALRRPIPLDLFYLVTPIAASAGDEQLLLGRVLQTFNDHSILRQTELGADFPEGYELRVVLETPSVEEQTRIWHALEESYQLSVTYLVHVVPIDTAHEPRRVSPVLRRENDYRQILAVT